MIVPPKNNLEETIKNLRKKYYRDDLIRTQKTEEDYWKIFRRLSGGVINSKSKQTILEAAMQTSKKRTWTKRRAAILFSSFLKIDEYLRKLKTAQKSETERLEKLIWNYIHIIEAIPDECPLENIQKSSSKKKITKFLDADWREKMIELIDPKYQLDLVLFSFSGCRPGELANGIDAVITSDERLLLTIQTEKVKDGKIVIKDKINKGKTKLVDYVAGQEQRTLIFDIKQNNYFMLKLMEILYRTNDQRNPRPELDKCFRVNLDIANVKTLASAITRLGKKLFPNITENITPYCFRHQLVADLKSSGVSGDEISLIIGHAVDTTKEKYGFIRRSRDARSKIPIGVKTVLRLDEPTSINQLKKGRKRSKDNVPRIPNKKSLGGKFSP